MSKGSPTLLRFAAQARARGQELDEQAAKIVADFAHDGERHMEEIIETKTTPTGDARSERNGGSPGRIDSGLMINLVSSETSHDGSIYGHSGSVHEGTFGWTHGHEEYFELQERGTDDIEPMYALMNSGIQAREAARSKIDHAARGN